MDIPTSKQCSAENKEGSNRQTTLSAEDVCFHLKSQLILPKQEVKKRSRKFKMTYLNCFEIVKKGILSKKTLNTNWNSRYFVLTATRLMYFAGEDTQQLKGCFNLVSLIEYNLRLEASYPQICLFVLIKDKQENYSKILLILQVEETNLFDEWKVKLENVITRLYKLERNVLDLFPKLKQENLMENNKKIGKSNANFWNNLTISKHELLKYASHLDIIFMRSKNPISYLHRFFMRSHYDHVAVLIKDQNQQIYIFQSIQSKGVCISNLENLLATFRQEYEEFGYRKLLCQLDQKIRVQVLEEYVNGLIGKKYELSITKLLIDNETELSDSSEDNKLEMEEKAEKTYFCSELIADIYLRFGILVEGKSNNYWPKDFEDADISLSNGFRLSPMMTVQLEQPSEASQLSQNQN